VLASIHKALGSISSTVKKKKKSNQKLCVCTNTFEEGMK
jgi:hypothetical protein